MAEWAVTFLIVAAVGGAIVWALTHPSTSKPAGPAPTSGEGNPGRPSPHPPSRGPSRAPTPRTWENRQ